MSSEFLSKSSSEIGIDFKFPEKEKNKTSESDNGSIASESESINLPSAETPIDRFNEALLKKLEENGGVIPSSNPEKSYTEGNVKARLQSVLQEGMPVEHVPGAIRPEAREVLRDQMKRQLEETGNMFPECKNIRAILSHLKVYGPIEGSQKVYTYEELEAKIKDLEEFVKHVDRPEEIPVDANIFTTITNKGNLRTAVHKALTGAN